MSFDTTSIILIVLAIVMGVAYFSLRNRRKQKEKR